MIEDKLKSLSGIPDLELLQELPQMFELAWNDKNSLPIGNEQVMKEHLIDFMISLGKTSGIYSRFLDKLEQQTLNDISEKERLEYLYSFNYSVGITLGNLVYLTILSKLNNQDIHNGYTNLCNNYKVEYFITDCQQIHTITKFSRFINIQSQVYNNPEINLRPIVNYQAQVDFDLPSSELFLVAGKIVNHSFLGLYHRYIFNLLMCCEELMRSIELNEIKLDNQVFSSKVLQLWVNTFTMLDGFGYDWDSIQRVYAVAYKIRNDETKGKSETGSSASL